MGRKKPTEGQTLGLKLCFYVMSLLILFICIFLLTFPEGFLEIPWGIMHNPFWLHKFGTVPIMFWISFVGILAGIGATYYIHCQWKGVKHPAYQIYFSHFRPDSPFRYQAPPPGGFSPAFIERGPDGYSVKVEHICKFLRADGTTRPGNHSFQLTPASGLKLTREIKKIEKIGKKIYMRKQNKFSENLAGKKKRS